MSSIIVSYRSETSQSRVDNGALVILVSYSNRYVDDESV